MSPSTATAEFPALSRKCNEAIHAADVEIKDLNAILFDQEALNANQAFQIKLLQADVSAASPLLPWWAWTLIGAGAGAFLATRH